MTAQQAARGFGGVRGMRGMVDHLVRAARGCALRPAAALCAALLMGLALFAAGQAEAQSSVRPPANAVDPAPNAPGERAAFGGADEAGYPVDAPAAGALSPRGGASDAELWRAVRAGESFEGLAGGAMGARLIQTEAAGWDTFRDGPILRYGAYALGGIVALLALFYLIRGRIRIDAGKSGYTIERFKGVERFGHWLLAGSFILLALTGLNLLFGKPFLMPLIGKEAFATVTLAGKWVHNNVAWAFMLSLVLTFLLWVRHNIPSRVDLKWIAQGGGLLRKGVHPPAKKFNFGQKIIFWSVMVLGASVSASGIALIFPFETGMFQKTFTLIHSTGGADMLAGWGIAVPATVTPMMEQQLAVVWHAIVAFAMIVIVIAHIYIGTVGMEGAFDAMGSGQVDENWAKEHHGLWVDEVRARTPAE